MRIFVLLFSLACLALVHSRSTPVEKPRQLVRETVVLGHKLPINATSLGVCFKSTNSSNCDVFKTTAHFSLEAKRRAGMYHLKRPLHMVRIFEEQYAVTKRNIFNSNEIYLTLKDVKNDKMLKSNLSIEWVTLRTAKDVIWLGLLNETHPNEYVQDLVNAMATYDLTGDDSKVRDLVIVGLKLEIYCKKGYFEEDCSEHCPQGCVHGKCRDGVCTACEYPYHGEACDRCGEYGNCEHGQCAEQEDGNIMSARCQCDRIFEGVHCEILHRNCSIVQCAPKGTCNAKTDRCECKDSRFRGNHCEIYFYWGSYYAMYDIIAFTFAGLLIAFVFSKIRLAVRGSDCDDFADGMEELKVVTAPEDEELSKKLLDDSLLEDIKLGRETLL